MQQKNRACYNDPLKHQDKRRESISIPHAQCSILEEITYICLNMLQGHSFNVVPKVGSAFHIVFSAAIVEGFKIQHERDNKR